MYRAGLLLMLLLSLFSMLWGVNDLANASAEHMPGYVGLAKLGAGAILATLAIGFGGMLDAIGVLSIRYPKIKPATLPKWLRAPRK